MARDAAAKVLLVFAAFQLGVRRELAAIPFLLDPSKPSPL
jgi:hypothetical protein